MGRMRIIIILILSILLFSYILYAEKKISAEISGNEFSEKQIYSNLLEQKLQEGRAFMKYILTAFMFYIGINGALLKFAFDKDADKGTRVPFCVGGILISLLNIAVCVITTFVIIENLKSDILNLNEQLGKPLIDEQLLYLSQASGMKFFFSLIVLSGWGFILWKELRKINGKLLEDSKKEGVGL